MARWSVERKAGAILVAISVTEGSWLIVNLWANPRGFLWYAGWLQGSPPSLGWILALIVAVAFTVFACRLPSVRTNLFALTGLKMLGLTVAISAGFCEETILGSF